MSDTDLKFPDFQTMGYGRYTEFKPLSRGGSAVLQTCRDKNLGRTVVIKTLHAHLAQHEAMRARFLREARVTAQLQHPATVPVYEISAAGQQTESISTVNQKICLNFVIRNRM